MESNVRTVLNAQVALSAGVPILGRMAVPYPIAPQLARLEEDLPRGDGWVYEPKWDGFRAILFKEGRKVRLQSRNGKDLSHRFLEVQRAALRLPDSVLDGELVVVIGGRLEFDGLISRLEGGASSPPAFVAFDALSWGDDDLRTQPFAKRRAVLEELEPNPFIQVTPQTSDVEAARNWLTDSFAMGFEGVVAKKSALRYMAGERSMVKVKHYESIDVVVAGYTGNKGQPRALVVGLYDSDGRLHHVGTTSMLREADRIKVAALPLSENSFTGLQPDLNRWQSHRLAAWFPVAPELVGEVAFNRLDGMRFRHSIKFLRWRPDRSPESCTYAQLARFRLITSSSDAP
jgi:ATP-dependent DNA ligase